MSRLVTNLSRRRKRRRETGEFTGTRRPRVESDRVTEEGARTLCGGKRHGETGFFVEPTVLDVQHLRRVDALRRLINNRVAVARWAAKFLRIT
jgi:hypothetical protein